MKYSNYYIIDKETKEYVVYYRDENKTEWKSGYIKVVI